MKVSLFNKNKPYNGWKWNEWAVFQKHLLALSLPNLKKLCKKSGVKFFVKNISKEDCVNTLIEAPKNDLINDINKQSSKKRLIKLTKYRSK